LSPWAFDGKRRNDLAFAFVEELKILLAEGADGVPLAVASHNWHQHQIRSATEGRGQIMRDQLGGVWGSGGLRVKDRDGQNADSSKPDSRPDSYRISTTLLVSRHRCSSESGTYRRTPDFTLGIFRAHCTVTSDAGIRQDDVQLHKLLATIATSTPCRLCGTEATISPSRASVP
jgi:hypothetical protein